jgi:hypothetical protein
MQIAKFSSWFFLWALFLLPVHAYWPQSKRYIVMLDPAGDAKNRGRTIDDNFEAGITLSYARALKTVIESSYPEISVIITRSPGESLTELQRANFANRLTVDLYININFYQNIHQQHTVHIYSFVDDKKIKISKKPSPFAFYPRAHAYLFSQAANEQWAHRFYTLLTTTRDYSHLFKTESPLRFPIKGLTGIYTPALAFEASLTQAADWELYVDPVVNLIATLISEQPS